jgi:hypothetical protein
VTGDRTALAAPQRQTFALPLTGGLGKQFFPVSFSPSRCKDKPEKSALISAALSSDGWYQ